MHLPWCVQKCPYCDFNSHGLRGALPEAAYLEALKRDIDAEATRHDGRRIETVFFGGGTPSLFSADGIGRILSWLDAAFGFVGSPEITLEANPGTAEAARFAGFRAAGVNRLSIGVQSFDDHRLAALGRIHSAEDAENAFALARRAGFDNINLDLMFALPGQSVAAALEELQRATALGAEHLSWYQLTLEPNTRFAETPPANLPEADVQATMQFEGAAVLGELGYARYEVSAYARAGRACAHNLNYWRFGDYLGIGAGAHGKRTRSAGVVERRWKHRHPKRYLAAEVQSAEVSEVAADQVPFEFMLNALRLVDGVDVTCFEVETGRRFTAIEDTWSGLVARGLVEPADSGRLRCTELGYRWLNEVVLGFLPG